MSSSANMAGRYSDLLSVVTGLIAHQIFKRSEPTAYGFLISTTVFFFSSILLTNDFDSADLTSSTPSILPALKHLAIYLLTLSISIGIFRLFFNPLCEFPGQKLAALSKWHCFEIARRGKTHLYTEALHQKYGDYVRVGPNEISISNPDDLPVIHGAKSKFNKGPFYSGNLNEAEPSLFAMTDYEAHRKRRKVWDVAMGARAMTAYEPRVKKCIERFVDQFDRLADSGEILDLTDWLELLIFDIMGVVSFDVDFHMVETGKKHKYVEFVHSALQYVASTAAVSWVLPIVFLLPLPGTVKKRTAEFKRFGKQAFETRLQQGAVEQDVFGFLLKESQQSPSTKMSNDLLEADTRMTIIGGSDTTSVAINSLCYWLMLNPNAHKKIREELQWVFEDGNVNAVKLGDPKVAPYLNGCINEALRLLPSGPNGNQRVVNNPGGITLGGKFVPEGTKISVHCWTLHHDPRNFEKPWEFIPERWIPESGFKDTHNAAAFIPFSLGAYQCIGRKLAYLQMRLFTYYVLTEFDMSFAPGFDAQQYIDKTETYQRLRVPSMPVKLVKVGKSSA